MNSTSKEHKYEVIAEKLRRLIEAGDFSQGLPGIHSLSKRFSANFKTVNRAMAILESDGLIYTKRGEGRFVTRKAQGLKSKVTLLMKTQGHFFEPLLQQLSSMLRENCFFPVIIDSYDFRNEEADVMQILDLASGVLVADLSQSGISDFVNDYHDRYDQTVVLGHLQTDLSDVCSIEIDYHAGVKTAIDYFISMGHERIAFILPHWPAPKPPPDHIDRGQMICGYRDGMADASLSHHARIIEMQPDEMKHENQEILRQLLGADNRPTAILTFADYYAAKVVMVASQLGLGVPDDLALIGFNNTPWCDYLPVPLSSMSLNEAAICDAIVEALTNARPEDRWMIKPSLMIRESCGGSRRILKPARKSGQQ